MRDLIADLAQRLMRAVVAAGITADDTETAVRVMREEVKAFLTGDGGKYADERALVGQPGGDRLAFASLVAECVRRIAAERPAPAPAWVEVDRETVVDHTTRLSRSIRVF